MGHCTCARVCVYFMCVIMWGKLSVKVEQKIVITHKIPNCFEQIIFYMEQTNHGGPEPLLIHMLKPRKRNGDKRKEPTDIMKSKKRGTIQ